MGINAKRGKKTFAILLGHFFSLTISLIPKTLRIQMQPVQLPEHNWGVMVSAGLQEQKRRANTGKALSKSPADRWRKATFPIGSFLVYARRLKTFLVTFKMYCISLLSNPCVFFNKLYMLVIENTGNTTWICKSLELISTSLKGYLRKMDFYYYDWSEQCCLQ